MARARQPAGRRDLRQSPPCPPTRSSTFGCQMNVARLRAHGRGPARHGYTEVAEPADADLIVVQHLQRAREGRAEAPQRGRAARPLKRAGRDLVLAVAGCVAQQEGERAGQAHAADRPRDRPDNIAELPRLAATSWRWARPPLRPHRLRPRRAALSQRAVRARAHGATALRHDHEGLRRALLVLHRAVHARPRALPAERARSSPRSRALVAAGVREVTLLGQTVNSYRDPPDRRRSLRAAPASARSGRSRTRASSPALLRAHRREVPALARLRYTSPHPRHVTRSLIRAHAELAVLARHVHLPVQSGSDRMLKRMIRRYTRAEYVERAAALRARGAGPHALDRRHRRLPRRDRRRLRGDALAGREVGFTRLFGFKYSPRPYTPALQARRRRARGGEERAARAPLRAERGATRARTSRRSSARRERVLVEGRDKNRATSSGRTERNEIVHFAARPMPSGKWCPCASARRTTIPCAVTSSRASCSRPARSPQPGASARARRALPVVAGP